MKIATSRTQSTFNPAVVSGTLFICMLMTLALYGFLLLRTVMHVEAMRATERSIAMLEADIHSMQARAVRAEQSIRFADYSAHDFIVAEDAKRFIGGDGTAVVYR